MRTQLEPWHVHVDDGPGWHHAVSHLSERESAGVEVTAFNPTQGPRNHFQINFRNHRKIVVVDGRIG